jgi:hypothetical protein
MRSPQELRPEHAVDVLGEAVAIVVQGLPAQRARQQPAEDHGTGGEDPGAGEEEDAQQCDGAVNRPDAEGP